jgi:hypothetical protein
VDDLEREDGGHCDGVLVMVVEVRVGVEFEVKGWLEDFVGR